METESPAGNPAPPPNHMPSATVDDQGVEFTSGASTPQPRRKGMTDWLTWDETGQRSTTAYVVKLFGFWLVAPPDFFHS